MNVFLDSVPFGCLKEYIHVGVQGDDEFKDYFETKQVKPTVCEHIFDFIDEARHLMGLKYYKVFLKDNGRMRVIGFTVLSKYPTPWLYSFAINKEYRNREVLSEWVKSLKKELGDTWILTLYNKNTRAINFFKKQGLTETYKDNEKTLLLWQFQQQ